MRSQDQQPWMGRRDALRLMVAVGALPMLGASGGSEPQAVKGGELESPTRMPVIFLAHGSPFLLDDRGWVAELAAWSRALPRPRAVLMISAHWEQRPVTLGATEPVPLVYDFSGFPKRYYEVTYPAPGAPDLAASLRGRLGSSQTVMDAPRRGLDHGAYVPLVAMYPDADVPVLQMSLPTMDPAALFALGRELAPLREEGVLIVGSGFITHNLRTIDTRPEAVTPSWASDFDAWVSEVIAARDIDALVDYRRLAPGVEESLPSHEHFVPLVVAVGAGHSDLERVRFPITGWMGGSFTRRSVQFG